jgi:hypothetical protein
MAIVFEHENWARTWLEMRGAWLDLSESSPSNSVAEMTWQI